MKDIAFPTFLLVKSSLQLFGTLVYIRKNLQMHDTREIVLSQRKLIAHILIIMLRVIFLKFS